MEKNIGIQKSTGKVRKSPLEGGIYLIIFCFRNSPIGDGIPVSRSAPKDWDAPEFEEDNPEAYEVPHGIKRKRRLIAREDSVSPPPQTLKFGEENEDRWTKKSKIPRLVKY